jgi:hypothetical protein
VLAPNRAFSNASLTIGGSAAMSLFEMDHGAEAKPRRNWLVETLIVAGILAFGGFALFADAPQSAISPLNSVIQTGVHH